MKHIEFIYELVTCLAEVNKSRKIRKIHVTKKYAIGYSIQTTTTTTRPLTSSIFEGKLYLTRNSFVPTKMTEEKEANGNHDSDTAKVENENAKNNVNQGFVLNSRDMLFFIMIERAYNK